MKRSILWTAFALVSTIAAAPMVLMAPAQAQPYGDRDHDGIPNRYDRRNDNGAFGDRDHDGIPNALDHRNDNGPRGDRDHDGVPNAWDRNPNNAYRR